MKAIICIDENKGMLFNHRRQSRDRILVEKVLEITKNSVLYMTEYSKRIFPFSENIKITEKLSDKNGDCFWFLEEKIEDISVFHEVYIFNWNTIYPADIYFPYDLEEEGFSLVSAEDFKGNSHSVITLSLYRRTI